MRSRQIAAGALAGAAIAALLVWLILSARELEHEPPAPNQAAETVEEASPSAGETKELQVSSATPVVEPVRRDIRDVTPPSVHRPPPVEGRMITRLPAAETSAPEPRRQPERWPNPVVVTSGRLVSQDRTLVIAGIDPLAPDDRCPEKAGDLWPCGRFAKTALQRLVRQRSIACEATEKEREQEIPEDGDLVVRCKVSGRDIGAWLVEQGWARAIPGGDYEELQSQARAAERGQWSRRHGG